MRRFCVAGALWCLAGAAIAEETLAPPAGAKQLLEVGADGVQVYVCSLVEQRDKAQIFVWVFDEPEATLFDAEGRQIGTHSKGPTWTLADESEITGEVVAKKPSPQPRTIPWLLLKAKSHQGAGPFAAATFIRRVETKGGAEPVGGCDADHKGDVARMRYSATYQFFGL
ncbi:DUF3455 domain-containing protein [Methylocapsa aurea]|uniref:DUF3455 domain-containing protein n=1 Tax=Methylocapsa aurea TaxID=663610 RepID=UPI000559D726|nr:DUF3455 domain-containing protein [Methylocapsa aurea]